MACKTFLCENKWLCNLESKDYFQLQDLVSYVDQKGQKIGLIIDLNRSTSYYNFESIKKKSLLLSNTKYYKFKLENGQIPCEEITKEICQVIKESHEKNEIIVVHCFNGINRTGYIVCRFLCEAFGLAAEEAIEHFEKARGYKMQHECLINELKKRCP